MGISKTEAIIISFCLFTLYFSLFSISFLDFSCIVTPERPYPLSKLILITILKISLYLKKTVKNENIINYYIPKSKCQQSKKKR